MQKTKKKIKRKLIKKTIKKHKNKKKKGTLLEIIAGLGGLTCFVISLFFLSTNLTGNVIGETNSSWIGAFLFILSLIGIFFYLRKK